MTNIIPRGVRNRNPGNIRKGKDQWQGMSADQSGDSAFVTFDGPQWGVRAMVKILLNYQRDGLDTIAKMMRRWAPAEDSNDPKSYAAMVAQGVGVGVDVPVRVSDYAIASRMIPAMIKVECAGYTYERAVIDEGLRLAGIIVPANAAPASPRMSVAGPPLPASGIAPSPAVRAAPWWWDWLLKLLGRA